MSKQEKPSVGPPSVTKAHPESPCYTQGDIRRLLYSIDLAEGIARRGANGVKKMKDARQEQWFTTNKYFNYPINSVLRVVIPFRSLEVDDFAVVASLAWLSADPFRCRAINQLWAEVERMRPNLSTEQLALLEQIKNAPTIFEL